MDYFNRINSKSYILNEFDADAVRVGDERNFSESTS